jgi:cytochrome c biogenesis protein ResB
MRNFFLSLNTAVWTLFVLLCLFFIGSYMLPMHRPVFDRMNNDLLFHWIKDIAADNVWQTWWFFAALAGLVLLTLNTIFCSIQSARGKWSRSDFLLRIAPQVIHIGFLFILLAHLLGAGWGYKLSGIMPDGGYAPLPGDLAIRLNKIHVETDALGFMTDWSVEASLYDSSHLVKSGTLGPNSPLFYDGTGVYLKSLNFERGPAALLLITKDPGAIWALVGGVLFVLGSVTLLALKWEKN